MPGRTDIERIEVSAYKVPTDQPESDGTLRWDSTGVIVVEAFAGGQRGVGWTYNHPATAGLIESKLASAVCGHPAMDVKGCWDRMHHLLRNIGTRGVAASAVAAVDVALWDLKARLLELPLVSLLGQVRERVALYGSGGFTAYDLDRLQQQLAGWVDEGFGMVKMKVGREPERDPVRVRAAREAIGDRPELFVDGNGAYSRKQALALAEIFSQQRVTWFEEPVSSDDLAGLHYLRDRTPAGMNVTAGEYAWEPFYVRHMLEAEAVDVMQVDATRCLGITGFMAAATLCEARSMPLSAHCAPWLHLHPCCAASPVVHIEFFHDHCRIERMLFDGAVEPAPSAGQMTIAPDLSRPGHGLSVNHERARRFAA